VLNGKILKPSGLDHRIDEIMMEIRRQGNDGGLVLVRRSERFRSLLPALGKTGEDSPRLYNGRRVQSWSRVRSRIPSEASKEEERTEDAHEICFSLPEMYVPFSSSQNAFLPETRSFSIRSSVLTGD
jgi:hypothetical protein